MQPAKVKLEFVSWEKAYATSLNSSKHLSRSAHNKEPLRHPQMFQEIDISGMCKFLNNFKGRILWI